jgi:SAM-dependent methyltransferase
MTQESKNFIKFIKENYDEYFYNKHVLEIVLNKKNTYRNLFHNCCYYNNINLGNLAAITTSKDIYYDTNFFDFIISNDLLEYDPEYKKSIENFYKILAPNGLLCIICGSNSHHKDDTKIDKTGYYKNLDIHDIDNVLNLNHSFHHWNSYYNKKSKELFFVGIKKNLYHRDIPRLETFEDANIINTTF